MTKTRIKLISVSNRPKNNFQKNTHENDWRETHLVHRTDLHVVIIFYGFQWSIFAYAYLSSVRAYLYFALLHLHRPLYFTPLGQYCAISSSILLILMCCCRWAVVSTTLNHLRPFPERSRRKRPFPERSRRKRQFPERRSKEEPVPWAESKE